jgi:hypothetical protein
MDKYYLEIQRLAGTTSASNGIKANRLQLIAIPFKKTTDYGNHWINGSIILDQITNGRWYGPKWMQNTIKICEKEKIYDLPSITKMIQEVRSTHHLALKKKFTYLTKDVV